MGRKQGGEAMIEKKKAGKKNTVMTPDLRVYDIDIDFKIKNGEPVWVVILGRIGHKPQPQLNIDSAM